MRSAGALVSQCLVKARRRARERTISMPPVRMLVGVESRRSDSATHALAFSFSHPHTCMRLAYGVFALCVSHPGCRPMAAALVRSPSGYACTTEHHPLWMVFLYVYPICYELHRVSTATSYWVLSTMIPWRSTRDQPLIPVIQSYIKYI